MPKKQYLTEEEAPVKTFLNVTSTGIAGMIPGHLATKLRMKFVDPSGGPSKTISWEGADSIKFVGKPVPREITVYGGAFYYGNEPLPGTVLMEYDLHEKDNWKPMQSVVRVGTLYPLFKQATLSVGLARGILTNSLIGSFLWWADQIEADLKKEGQVIPRLRFQYWRKFEQGNDKIKQQATNFANAIADVFKNASLELPKGPINYTPLQEGMVMGVWLDDLNTLKVEFGPSLRPLGSWIVPLAMDPQAFLSNPNTFIQGLETKLTFYGYNPNTTLQLNAKWAFGPSPFSFDKGTQTYSIALKTKVGSHPGSTITLKVTLQFIDQIMKNDFSLSIDY